MSDPILISPLWLELLAERMKKAGLDMVEISETDWIIKINQMINAGIENEFVKEEMRLVRERFREKNVWETGSPVHEQREDPTYACICYGTDFSGRSVCGVPCPVHCKK